MKNIFIGLFLLFTGCATLPKEQCQNTDWERIGYVDGEHGYAQEKFKQHVATCEVSMNEADQTRYMSGWEKGLETYCTAENGYKVGARGMYSGAVCSKEKYPKFSEQFFLGRDVFDLKTRRGKIREQIDQKNENPTTLDKVQEVLSAITQTPRSGALEQQDQELTQSIYELEKKAATNYDGESVFTMVEEHGDAASGYGGAWVGTFVGFGVGHAIQGRYWKDGWKWTLGEVGSFALMGVSANDCKTESSGGNSNTTCSSGNYTGVAVLAWLGFRVWQSYNLFSYANKKNNIYTMVTPTGLLLTYQF